MEPVRFRNLRLNITDREKLIAAIKAGDTIRLATANPEFIEEASHNKRFAKALEGMTHVTVDGTGLAIGLFVSGKESKRYRGITFLEEALRGNVSGISRIAILGGQQGSAPVLQALYPDTVVFAEEGGEFDLEKPVLSAELQKKILDSKPDLLAIGLGAPKQELLMQAITDLPIQVMAGLGGSFNFLTGQKPRAPHIFQTTGMEWLWRSLREKGHVKRLWRAVVVFPLRTATWIALGRYIGR